MEIHASVSVEGQHGASGNLRRCPRWRNLFRLIGWLLIPGWTIFEDDAVCVYQRLGRQASSCRFDVPVLLMDWSSRISLTHDLECGQVIQALVSSFALRVFFFWVEGVVYLAVFWI